MAPGITYAVPNGYLCVRYGEDSASAIAELSSGSTRITDLELQSDFTPNQLIQLFSSLVSNRSLTRLNMGTSVSINPDGIGYICQALQNNTTLTDLSLGHFEVSAEGKELLGQALRVNTTLKYLNLKSLGLEESFAPHLNTALGANRNLVSLSLGWNLIGNAGALAISRALANNTTLTELDLTSHGISHDGCIQLSAALTVNHTLAILKLGQNRISGLGAAALAQTLGVNSTLTELDLRYNSIKVNGAIQLGNALATNSTLKVLNLENNKIATNGAQRLSQALRTNSALTTLHLQSNAIGADAAGDLCEMIAVNSTLTELNLFETPFDAGGARLLALALTHNTALRVLNVRHQGNRPVFDDATAVHFARALTVNTTLTELWADFNAPSTANTLLSTLRCHPSLISLNHIRGYMYPTELITKTKQYNSNQRHLSLLEHVWRWACKQVFTSYSQNDKDRIYASFEFPRWIDRPQLFDDWSAFESAVASAGLDLEAGVRLFLTDRAHSQTLQR